MKRGKYFILNLTIHGFRFLYGVKKIFHSIVGSNGMAWVVRVWKEKQSFFIINLAKWQFLSLYGAWKEVKIFLFQLSKWTFAVQIVVKKGKSFGFWLRFPSFPTRYIGKMIFFFLVLWQLNKAIQYVWQTASRWNKYATTFPLQERAKTYLCSYKRFVLFYRHDLYCQIMILPYSHSLCPSRFRGQ